MPTGREFFIDAWRAAAIGRVLLYHATELGWLTVVFPAMGLMFALAGSLTARSLLSCGDASAVVIGRMRRLLPSVWAFAAAALVASVWLGWGTDHRPAERFGLLWWLLPLSSPTRFGGDDAWVFTGGVWYLTAYLWFVLLSPALLRLFRTWPGATLFAALALPVVLHLELITVGGALQPQFYDLSQYGACWIVGFAHRTGYLARLRAAVLWPLAAALALATLGRLVATGQTISTADLHQLPEVNALWSAAFAAVVLRLHGRARRAGVPVLLGGRVMVGAVRAVNARAVTIFLWHYPALLLARWLVGFDPVAGPWLWPTGALMLVFTAVATLAVGWVEDVAARRAPGMALWRPPRPAQRGASTSEA